MSRIKAAEGLNKQVVLVPKAQGPFKEMWAPLRDLQTVYSVLRRSKPGEDRKQEGAVIFSLDRSLLAKKDNFVASLIYSDLAFLEEDTVYAEINTRIALDHIFHSPHVNAIGFNLPFIGDKDSPLTKESEFHCIVRKLIIPRLLGMIDSSSPFLSTVDEHFDAAKDFHSKDQVYAAHHHVALTRELYQMAKQDVPSEVLALELETLLLFGQFIPASVLLKKAESLGAQGLEMDAGKARFLTVTGKSDEALNLLESATKQNQESSKLLLEIGRLCIIKGEHVRAAGFFEKILAKDPQSIEANLGFGIALSNAAFQSKSMKQLAAAEQALKTVISAGGYRKVEALHFLGSIAARLGMWDKVEKICSQSLMLRETATSRQNLVLSLHKQNKTEAFDLEFKFLEATWPKQAQAVRWHTGQSTPADGADQGREGEAGRPDRREDRGVLPRRCEALRQPLLRSQTVRDRTGREHRARRG